MTSNWTELTINDVCSVTDCQHKTAPTLDNNTEYRMLRTANIRNGQLRDVDETKSVTKEIYDQWSVRGYLTPGDVILTREAPMGEVALLTENEKYKYFLGQRMLQLKAFTEVITPEFLYYSLQTKGLQHQIMMNEGTGSVVSNIRIPLLKKMKLFVPTLCEQKKIIKVLIDIDNKMLLNKRIIVNLEQLSQTLFKHWFIDFEFPNEEGKPYKSSGGEMVESELGYIPEKWENKSLGNYIKLEKGLSYKGDYLDKNRENKNSIPLITIANFNFQSGFKDLKTKYYFGDYKEKHLLKEKDIIIAATDLTQDRKMLGAPAIVPNLNKIMIYSLDVFKISSMALPKYYLYFSLQTYRYRRLVGSSATGTTVLRISKAFLEAYKISLPNNLLLLELFNSKVEPMIEKILEIEKENKKLSKLRDTLLPKLLSGEIEIPDDLEV
ncbi:restriction endonuclease subunit S [Aerococcus viridans]|nr:restriction endonuclease subunit S [Aerococcus viridans]